MSVVPSMADRDGQIWMQEYERGKPRKAVAKIGPQGGRKGTRTTFRADPQMFETTEYSFETISQLNRDLLGAWAKNGH